MKKTKKMTGVAMNTDMGAMNGGEKVIRAQIN
jgi:hypothetical protein